MYENEGGLFFVDHTKFDPSVRMQKWDRQFRTLLSYPQVRVSHAMWRGVGCVVRAVTWCRALHAECAML